MSPQRIIRAAGRAPCHDPERGEIPCYKSPDASRASAGRGAATAAALAAAGALPCAPPPQLPPVHRRSGHLADRLLDAERGPGLAGLPALGLRAGAGGGGVHGLPADPLPV